MLRPDYRYGPHKPKDRSTKARVGLPDPSKAKRSSPRSHLSLAGTTAPSSIPRTSLDHPAEARSIRVVNAPDPADVTSALERATDSLPTPVSARSRWSNLQQLPRPPHLSHNTGNGASRNEFDSSRLHSSLPASAPAATSSFQSSLASLGASINSLAQPSLVSVIIASPHSASPYLTRAPPPSIFNNQERTDSGGACLSRIIDSTTRQNYTLLTNTGRTRQRRKDPTIATRPCELRLTSPRLINRIILPLGDHSILSATTTHRLDGLPATRQGRAITLRQQILLLIRLTAIPTSIKKPRFTSSGWHRRTLEVQTSMGISDKTWPMDSARTTVGTRKRRRRCRYSNRSLTTRASRKTGNTHRSTVPTLYLLAGDWICMILCRPKADTVGRFDSLDGHPRM